MPEQEKVVTKKFGGMPLRETLILSFSLICILAAGAYFTGIYDRLQEDAHVDRKYEQWRQTLSPERREWEKTLENSIGSYYWPLYKRDRLAGKETCWDYADSKPGLPTVFVIGDSISLGYTPVVRKNLKGKVNVERVPENCGKLSHALASVDKWLGSNHYKLIYFNFGIHDRRTPLATYQKELKELVPKLKQHADIVVFASSTPLPQDPSKEMDNLDILEKNQAAKEVMSENQIHVDDLYAFVEPNKHELMEANDCHFRSTGYVALGNHATETIKSLLKIEN
jgi:lysophospholipase L1-like esterase